MLELQEDLILEEVAPDQQLVQEMEKYLPHTYQIVSMVLLHLQFQHLPLMRAKVFTPRCALYQYKMFVITNIATTDDLSSMSLFWSKDHLSDGAVRQLLKSLPGFNWKRTILIRQLPLHLHQNLDHIVRELSEGSLVAELTMPVLIFTHGNSAPEVLRLPKGYYAGPLWKIHGKQVLTGWIGSHREKVEDFSRILEHLPAVGIFKERKSTPEQQNLPGSSLGSESEAQIYSSVESILGTGGFESGAQTDCSVESIPGATIGTKNRAQSYDVLESIPAATAEDETMLCTTGKKKCSIVSVRGDESVPTDASITMTAEANNARVESSNEETNESQDELVGWCVLKQGADIGMTYTTKGHRKIGLAKVATSELIRQVLDKQLNAFIMVTEDNTISIAMNKKLGFEEYTTDIILIYSPKKNNGGGMSGEVLS